MKRIFTLLACVLLAATFTFAQVPLRAGAGVLYAPDFAQWQVKLASSITATGSQAFTAIQGQVATPDGIIFTPFVVGGKIQVGAGSVAEVVQISAVSNCDATAQPAVTPVCTITATSFANSHSPSEPIVSADSGIMEAVGYASAYGGAPVRFLVDCGIVTLSTSSVTTTTTCYVPNTFIQAGSSSRVTTTITTSTSWAVGISGSTSSFSSANSTLTAATTSIANQPAGTLVGTTTGVGAVLVTAGTGAAGAGAVHIRVWGVTPAQSSF